MARAAPGHGSGVIHAGTPLVELLAGWQSDARRLIAEVRPSSHPEGVLPVADLVARQEALRRLRWTVLPRESRKHRFLWPQVAEFLRGDSDLVDDLLDSKRDFEREMIKLRWADERSRHFDDRLVLAIDLLKDYLAGEERLLPRLAHEMPAKAQDDVTRALARGDRWCPVQPHPDLPRAPWMMMILVPVVAVFDRLRDAVTTTPA